MARFASILVLGLALFLSACEASKPPVRVGILHSKSETMAKRESPLIDAALLAIEEINATPQNHAFIKKIKARYGKNRVVSDPMGASYFGAHIWTLAAQKAGSTRPMDVSRTVKNTSYPAPGGIAKDKGQNSLENLQKGWNGGWSAAEG